VSHTLLSFGRSRIYNISIQLNAILEVMGFLSIHLASKNTLRWDSVLRPTVRITTLY